MKYVIRKKDRHGTWFFTGAYWLGVKDNEQLPERVARFDLREEAREAAKECGGKVVPIQIKTADRSQR